jgi:hypothetical protein
MLRSRTRAIGRAALFACLAGVSSITQPFPELGVWSVVFGLSWAAIELFAYSSDLTIVLRRPVFIDMPPMERSWALLVTGRRSGILTEAVMVALIFASGEGTVILICCSGVACLLAVIITLWEAQYQAVVYVYTHVYPHQLQSVAVQRAEPSY